MNKEKEIFVILKDNLNLEDYLLEDLSKEIVEHFFKRNIFLSEDIEKYLEEKFYHDIWSDFSLISKDIFKVLIVNK